MANEVVKSDGNTLQINVGTVQLDNLDEEQKKSLRMVVAKAQVDLATELARKKIVLETTQAEVAITTGAVDSASRFGGSYDIRLNTNTPNGSLSIRAKKGFIFGND